MKRFLLIGAVALAAAWPASAQNAANGEFLYSTPAVAGKLSCGANACHGPLTNPQNRIASATQASAIQSAMLRVSQMQFLQGQLSDAQLNDITAYVAGRLGGTPGYLQVVATPMAVLSPATLNFGTLDLLTTGTPQTVTVGNAASASAPLVLGAIATSGSDFALAGGTCRAGLSLPIGANCTVLLAFTPTVNGTRSGQLNVGHSGAGGGSSVALTGTGTGTLPVIGVAPAAPNFSQTVGSSSDPLRVLVANTGTGALRLTSLRLAGANAAEFALDTTTSTCIVGVSVAPAQSCFVDVRFTPAAAGARSASLRIEHNAVGGVTTLALAGSGNATPRPGLMLDTLRLDLGNLTVATPGLAQPVTVTNNGQAPLNFSRIGVDGTRAAEFALSGSCAVGTPLAARASCTVSVALTPSALGAVAATLAIASDAPTALANVSLAGTGVAAAAPQVALSQAALGFGTVAIGGASAPRTAVLRNSGDATLVIANILSSSAEFAVTHDCPTGLMPGASCSLRVVFSPAAANAAEVLVISSNAASSPNNIVLTGLGSATGLAVLDWAEGGAPVAFGSAEVGATGSPVTRTLQNRGPGAARVSALNLAGADPGAFVVGGGTCGVGLTLAAGATCTVQLRFAPSAAGARAATFQLGSDASNPPELALSGTGSGVAVAQSALVAEPVALDYRPAVITTGARSEPLLLRIVNQGAADTTLAAVTTSAGFALTASGAADACPGVPWTLAPGAACSVSIVFAPSTGGSTTGQLKVTTSGGLSTDVVLQAEAQSVMTNQGSAETGGGALGLPWLLLLALGAIAAYRSFLPSNDPR